MTEMLNASVQKVIFNIFEAKVSSVFATWHFELDIPLSSFAIASMKCTNWIRLRRRCMDWALAKEPPKTGQRIPLSNHATQGLTACRIARVKRGILRLLVNLMKPKLKWALEPLEFGVSMELRRLKNAISQDMPRPAYALARS